MWSFVSKGVVSAGGCSITSTACAAALGSGSGSGSTVVRCSPLWRTVSAARSSAARFGRRVTNPSALSHGPRYSSSSRRSSAAPCRRTNAVALFPSAAPPATPAPVLPSTPSAASPAPLSPLPPAPTPAAPSSTVEHLLSPARLRSLILSQRSKEAVQPPLTTMVARTTTSVARTRRLPGCGPSTASASSASAKATAPRIPPENQMMVCSAASMGTSRTALHAAHRPATATPRLTYAKTSASATNPAAARPSNHVSWSVKMLMPR
mmetsp:Transcript_22697/g.73853  ORF Transcript_22697/g.73853 Transcript_22697/m.73853 type:complete len:265 (-) Transcript_22697:1043-1837(-)